MIRKEPILKEEENKYIESSVEELKEFIKALAVIPAPSNQECRRAEFVKNWITENGFSAETDEAGNVIWKIGVTEDNDLKVFMAHTDVVFSDEDSLPYHEEDGKMYCPGIGDDTARLCILLIAARYFAKKYSEIHAEKEDGYGIIIAANAGEEGLGNLKGSRYLTDKYKYRIKEFITIDGNPEALITRAVGSHRYSVTVKTRGGHSYNDFGNDNAIEKAAALIEELYRIEIPVKEDTKTTLNVGTINGGTSVNTIAEETDFLFEYRSDDVECLAHMKKEFERVLSSHKEKGVDISVKTLGIRPCGNITDMKNFRRFTEHIKNTEAEVLGIIPKEVSGSTDANYPLSLGIPAVCVGAGRAEKTHTREEYIYADSLKDGLKFVLALLLNC